MGNLTNILVCIHSLYLLNTILFTSYTGTRLTLLHSEQRDSYESDLREDRTVVYGPVHEATVPLETIC